MRLLYVAEMHYKGSAAKRFRIIEKVSTLDGPRDRITNQTFETLEAAEEFVRQQTEKGE